MMMISEPLITYTVLMTLSGFLFGMLFGRMTWGRAEKPEALAAAPAQQADVAKLTRELAASRDQVRPLADEVDRLSRELARLRKPEPVAAPAALPAPVPAPLLRAPDMPGSDVRQLKGVGDKFAQALAAVGLGSVAALAALEEGAVATIDTQLGVFNGRLRRDKLIEQAQLLCGGRTTEYEARFGKIGTTVGRA